MNSTTENFTVTVGGYDVAATWEDDCAFVRVIADGFDVPFTADELRAIAEGMDAHADLMHDGHDVGHNTAADDCPNS